MKKSEIVVFSILAAISLGASVYFYLTLFRTPDQATFQKQPVDFPNPVKDEEVSKPSTFLGTIFSKITPTPSPTPVPIKKPTTAVEFMGVLEKSYSDGGKSQLDGIRTEATSL